MANEQKAQDAKTQSKTSAEIELEQMKAEKAANEAKANAGSKTLELQGKIDVARAAITKCKAHIEDTAMESEFPGFIATFTKKLPLLEEQLADAEKALADFRLSLLTPGEKLAVKEIAEANELAEKAVANRDALIAKHSVTYPHLFVQQKATNATRAPRAGASTPTDGTVKPFMGTLNDKESDRKAVLSLHSAGTTSEADIIKKIYPGDYSIGGGAAYNHPITGANPRARIHAIRVEEDLVPKK